MSRWLLVFVVACGGGGGGGGGANREVSKIKYTHTSCEGSECAIAPAPSTFRQPDEDRSPPDPGQAAAAPEPTCNLVAEALVSLELGNYADPEERAPKVAAQERRCTAMKLSREDRQCVIDSHDKTSVAYCAPALFPKEPQPVAVSAARCDKAAKQMMTMLDAQLRQQRVPDQRIWERQLLVAIDACRTDRWNEQMAQCAEYYVPMYAQNCAYVQPTGMWKRLEARLAKARGE